MQIFDELEDSAADTPWAFPDAQLVSPVPSVRDGWVAAREGYTDSTFEMWPDTGVIPGPRRPRTIV